MRATATSLLLALSAASFIGCADGLEPAREPVAGSESELSWVAQVIWDQRDIPVCWNSPDTDFKDEKAWVRTTMRGQRSWQNYANVRFVGWGKCPTSFTSGIRITPGNDNVVTGGLGEQTPDATEMELDFTATPENRWTTCIDKHLDRKECIRVTAMHEFGHAIGFAHEQLRTDTPADCTAVKRGTVPDVEWAAYDPHSIMNYCDSATQLSKVDRRGAQWIYGVADGYDPRAADYNGDGKADLMCFDTNDGDKYIDYADAQGTFDGTDFHQNTSWCSGHNGVLYHGDFNGDNRDDLFCHDNHSGEMWIDYADASGHFAGTDFNREGGWCKEQFERLYVGDFNGDGKEDILCHEGIGDATISVDFADANGHFGGTDWRTNSNWCHATGAELYIGKFNDDGRDDLLCHNAGSGALWIDYADGNGHFDGTDWSRTDADWCRLYTAQLFVGDFNGDAQDDILCHHMDSGAKFIDYASPAGRFMGTDWTANLGWCTAQTSRLSVGRFNNDRRDDLLCHDIETGQMYLDYADASGQFGGTDWTRTGWCFSDPATLL